MRFERIMDIVALRVEGNTFVNIRDKYNISPSRARQLYDKGAYFLLRQFKYRIKIKEASK